MGKQRADVLGIVEAVYDFRGDDPTWIKRIADATEAAVGEGCGTVGLLYEVTSANAMRACAVVETGRPRGLAALARQVVDEGIDTAYIESSFRVIPCAMSSETPGIERTPFAKLFNPKGIRDMIGINGVDPSGVSAFIGVATPRKLKLPRVRREMLARVSAHIAAGYRLRRRMAQTPNAESNAVLTPTGRVEHAVGDAQVRAARSLLAEATRAIERARGRMRRDSPDEAVATWRSLVSARWSLVDHFESDGKRYVVAQRNESGGIGPAALTARERQVVAFVAIGHTTKHIAYELGLSPATVRVLIARACSKLGAASRAELVAALDKR